jgi:hypothetical protein
MKRAYSKPVFYMEPFTLSQSVASTCNINGRSHGIPKHGSKSTCNWSMGNFTVFLEKVDEEGNYIGPCAKSLVKVRDGAKYKGLCYNNPEGGATIFGS